MDGESGVVISSPGASAETGKWETDSTGSQAKIIKTTVVSAAWEEVESQRKSGDASIDDITFQKI